MPRVRSARLYGRVSKPSLRRTRARTSLAVAEASKYPQNKEQAFQLLCWCLEKGATCQNGAPATQINNPSATDTSNGQSTVGILVVGAEPRSCFRPEAPPVWRCSLANDPRTPCPRSMYNLMRCLPGAPRHGPLLPMRRQAHVPRAGVSRHRRCHDAHPWLALLPRRPGRRGDVHFVAAAVDSGGLPPLHYLRPDQPQRQR